jgi:ankyrin repeat protein
VVKLLLSKDSVDLNSNDQYGQTPLLWAALKGHEAVVKLLLAKDDVDPNSKNTVLLIHTSRSYVKTSQRNVGAGEVWSPEKYSRRRSVVAREM